MHRNPETLTTFFSSGTKLLLTFFLTLGFWHEVRDRHNFYYSDHSMWPNKHSAHPVGPSWTALAQVQISTPRPGSNLNSSPRVKSQLASPRNKSQLPAFSKITKNSRPIASGQDIIHTPESFPIWGFYYDICDCHILCVWVWTPALIAEQF